MNYTLETGLRGCLRHPRTMLLAVLTLALGLASVMTMLTLLSVLSADPLPGISHRLYIAWADSRPAARSGENDTIDGTGASVPPLWKLQDVQAMRHQHADVRQVALLTAPLSVSNADGSNTRTASAVLAVGPMLSMFGVPLRHGRAWTPEEEQTRAPVVVISRALSQRLLGREDGTGAGIRPPWPPYVPGDRHQRALGTTPTPTFPTRQRSRLAGPWRRDLRAGDGRGGRGRGGHQYTPMRWGWLRWLPLRLNQHRQLPVAGAVGRAAGWGSA